MGKKRIMISLALVLTVLMTGFAFANEEAGEEWGNALRVGRSFESMREFMTERFGWDDGEFEGTCPMADLTEEELEELREEALEVRINQVDELFEEGRITEEKRDELKERLEEGGFAFDRQGLHRGMGGMMKIERELRLENGEGAGQRHRGGRR